MALTALEIKHAKTGMHADGNGLYLRVQASGAKGWIFRFQLDGKRREMGIGTLSEQPAIEARAVAAELGRLVRDGIDPIDERKQREQDALESARRAEASTVLFRQVAADYIAAHRAGWRNAKHADQWANTLATYAEPVIGELAPAEVTTEHLLEILTPIWTTKPETASRVRARIELVLSYAKAKKLRDGENPAMWRGNLDALLPKPGRVKKVRHHPALPYSKMTPFMVALRRVQGIGARALEFAILTAARSGEVRLAEWREIDLQSATWIVPADRMKARREHRVPLSNGGLHLLNSLPRFDGTDLIFPGMREHRPMSDMTLSAVIRRMNEEELRWVDPKTNSQAVPHGFRSTFRDWCAEQTQFPAEMAEIALAHTVGDKVEAAYRRGDMFEKRRAMMQAWANWCLQESPEAAVP